MNDLAASHEVSPLADANAPQAAGNLTRKRFKTRLHMAAAPAKLGRA